MDNTYTTEQTLTFDECAGTVPAASTMRHKVGTCFTVTTRYQKGQPEFDRQKAGEVKDGIFDRLLLSEWTFSLVKHFVGTL